MYLRSVGAIEWRLVVASDGRVELSVTGFGVPAVLGCTVRLKDVVLSDGR